MNGTIEVLSQVIEEKEAEIGKLQETIERYERCQYTHHREVDISKMIETGYTGYGELPFPRFEMRVNILNKHFSQIEYLYGICYKHIEGFVTFIPFGQTIASGSYKKYLFTPGEYPCPMRDGYHIKTEMVLFNLPGYVLFNGIIHEIKLTEPELKSIKEDILNTVM